MIENQVLEFQSASFQKYNHISAEAFSRLSGKDNVASILLLQSKEVQKGKAPKRLIVANTHIHWNPDYCDVKLMQTYMLLERLMEFGASRSQSPVPMIIAGDFNSTTFSGAYELICTGRLPYNHADLLVQFVFFFCRLGIEKKKNLLYHHIKGFNYGVTHGYHHTLNVSSAYAKIGEPQFTNYTADFVGVLDYLFYSKDTLGVSKLLQPIDENDVKVTKMPNAYYPSDHQSLVAEIYFKP